jgi:hypothetical protein
MADAYALLMLASLHREAVPFFAKRVSRNGCPRVPGILNDAGH